MKGYLRNASKLGVEYWLLLILIPIISWNLYCYKGFNQNLTKMFLFVTALLLLIYYFSYFRSSYFKKQTYSRYLTFLLGTVVISIINAFLFWDQSPVLTYRACASIFYVLFFFVLKKIGPSHQDVIVLIFIFLVIYTVLWAIAMIAAPKVLFGYLDEIDNNRGFYRVLQLRSLDFVFLAYFYAITRVVTGKNKFFYYVVAIICLVLTFFTLSRMFILAIIFMTVAYFLRRKKSYIILIALFFVFTPSKILFENEVTNSMVNITQKQFEEDEGYSRSEYIYVFKLFPFRIPTFLFGNGAAHEYSEYGKKEAVYKDSFSFNRSDTGYVNIYVTYGICGLLCYLAILMRVIKQDVDDDYLYLKLYIYYLFIVSITSNSFIDFTISFALVLYLLDKDTHKRKVVLHNNRISAIKNRIKTYSI